MNFNFRYILVFSILGMNIFAMYYMLTRKRHFIMDILLFTGTLAAAISAVPFLCVVTQNNKGGAVFLSGCLFLIPTILLFKEDWKVKSFAFFVIFAIVQYISLIFHFMNDLCARIFAAGTVSSIIAYMEIAAIFLLYRYSLKSLRPVLNVIREGNAILLLLPIGACFFLAIIRTNGALNFGSFTIAIMMTGILLATAYLVNSSIHLINQKGKLEKQLAYQIEHYKQLTTSMRQTYIYRQDIRHHLASVGELLRNQEMAATREYLDRMDAQYTDSYLPSFCSNKYVDAVVAHYYKIARRDSMQVTAKLSLPEDIGIEFLDLCVIIGNCFENAIEACRAVREPGERHISIQAKVTHGYAAITIKNSCASEIKRQKGRFLSSKQPNRLGIGLESVALLAQKYEGDVHIATKENVFTVAISLKIPMHG